MKLFLNLIQHHTRAIYAEVQIYIDQPRGLVVRVSGYLIMSSRVRFPVLPWEFSLNGEDSRGDHGLGMLVEFRFKGPPGTTSSYITSHIIGTT